jgi:hypothetical protein
MILYARPDVVPQPDKRLRHISLVAGDARAANADATVIGVITLATSATDAASDLGRVGSHCGHFVIAGDGDGLSPSYCKVKTHGRKSYGERRHSANRA